VFGGGGGGGSSQSALGLDLGSLLAALQQEAGLSQDQVSVPSTTESPGVGRVLWSDAS
jgi:hypothetical protein